MKLLVKDVAGLLNVTEKTIYRWIKQDRIPVHRINGQHRFNRAEILEWATSRRIPISLELLMESDTEQAPLPSLAEALKAGGVFYRVQGQEKSSVLQSVVQLMRVPEAVDLEFLYRVLLARETLGSTGIGDGIAIPHVRNPIVLHIEKPVITLCFLDNPIPFDAIDGKPVHILFTLVSPTVRAHLHLLARLGFVLKHPPFRNVLHNQALRDEIMQRLIAAESSIPSPPIATAEHLPHHSW
ncbi:MAG: PTS sugar transporter subunit IIA [Kiritimatiellia bacterium]|nr:PTS sugar transporter subunit IIA [Lentisphaerota bacterium]